MSTVFITDIERETISVLTLDNKLMTCVTLFVILVIEVYLRIFGEITLCNLFITLVCIGAFCATMGRGAGLRHGIMPPLSVSVPLR